MKEYQCHKIVQAEPMTQREYSMNFNRPCNLDPHDPDRAGYHVVYADGYESWSPKKVFEEGYTEIPKKAMLSQPMAGKTDEEIIATRERAIKVLEAKGFTVVNTLFTDEWYSKEKMLERGVAQIPLCFMAKSLENMSLCHAVYFCEDWEKARGCRIEHEAAIAYGLVVIYEE